MRMQTKDRELQNRNKRGQQEFCWYFCWYFDSEQVEKAIIHAAFKLVFDSGPGTSSRNLPQSALHRFRNPPGKLLRGFFVAPIVTQFPRIALPIHLSSTVDPSLTGRYKCDQAMPLHQTDTAQLEARLNLTHQLTGD